MWQGFQFFADWCEDVTKDGINPDTPSQTAFLSWQVCHVCHVFLIICWNVYSLLNFVYRLGIYYGSCRMASSTCVRPFLEIHPDHFITPVQVNGSAIESYFSQMKYAARGQLSAANYQSAQAAIETSRAASTKRPREADYRDAGLGYSSSATSKEGTQVCPIIMFNYQVKFTALLVP